MKHFFDDFDWEVLNDPEYKEDAVREDIVSPLLKALGYNISGKNKMVRSRQLTHPFVFIGSKKKKINIIPDYILEVDGKPIWILDAKAPNEELINSPNAEQAYSYAMHGEIRANYYALCNGRVFVLYHIKEFYPILSFSVKDIKKYWDILANLLSAENVQENDPFKSKPYAKDYGLHLKRLGFSCVESLFFYSVPILEITKITDDLYSVTTNLQYEDSYCASFDFNHSVFLQLKKYIPQKVFELLSKSLEGTMKRVEFQTPLFFNFQCSLCGELQEVKKEFFLPLTVTKIV